MRFHFVAVILRFLQNSLRSRKCAPSGGALARTPFLWGLASETWACPLVPAPFVSVGLRTPSMLFATAQIRYWLFDKPGSLALLLTLLWDLWRRWNTWVHEHTLCPQPLVIGSAISLCHDYASASAPSPNSSPAAAAPPQWRPPPAGSVKINVDGAYLPSARIGAIGVLSRDSSGAVLGGFTRPVPVSGPASSVEASALRAGLEFATACGWTSAIVESDAATLVNKIRRPSPDLSLLGDLLAPARNLAAASHGRLQVCFAPRSANSVAHTLVSWACKNNDVISFSSVCPKLISQLVLDDLSSSF
ncbi:hypothetical protein V6N13_051237 [Hibiscus sabdariffa]